MHGTMKKRQALWQALAWYLLFGLIHELSHVAAAIFVFGELPPFVLLVDVPALLMKALLGRSCSIPGYDPDDTSSAIIRNAGWIFSVLVASYCCMQRRRLSQEVVIAAVATSIDAICTDLLGIGVIRGVPTTVLFCGNFGVILLNADAWTSDQGKTALDLMQEMIRITMMRGAQTGGVVAWTTTRNNELRGIRSRVVNGKRSDLSVRLRRRVEQDVLTPFLRTLRPGIRAFLGHTRFATSSKATFDGTHPHQWTPPRTIRVFNVHSSEKPPRSEERRVETFVSHNGDLDFYKVGSTHASLADIQAWLCHATGAPIPNLVDSAAIAGLMDLLRSAGSWALSLRFALLMDCQQSAIEAEPSIPIPPWTDFEKAAIGLEDVLLRFCQHRDVSLVDICSNNTLRQSLVEAMVEQTAKIIKGTDIEHHVRGSQLEEATGSTPFQLMRKTVRAFFDNDLFESTRLFLKQASGSFGLMITCSLDADRQVCIAAKGQPMSVGFFPSKGMVTFASELAAAKAGLGFSSPLGDATPSPNANPLDRESFRLDLNDLNGEVCLIKFSDTGRDSMGRDPMRRDRRYKTYELMGGNLQLTLFQPNFVSGDPSLLHRLVPIDDDSLIMPYPVGAQRDPVLTDIKDIPRVCRSIQANWKKPSLNRLTAWNLTRRLRKRLEDRKSGRIPSRGNTVDIMVTGCEVSLWVAEQFASDVQKSFPGLYIQSLSSNKILGVFGEQELPTPAIGHPTSRDVPDLYDTIVIIVSNSGGNFSPLACSSLLQSVTKNIFVVTSEWDTQIGKQLRSMFDDDDELYSSRIFTTEVGLRPAEPCSLTVVATHQLLTNLFEHICVVLGEPHFQDLTGAVITQQDLMMLEKCNQENICALEQIVGASRIGSQLESEVEMELRDAGKRWSRHVLENPKAYIMSIAYIVGTVTSGYPIATSIAIAAGSGESGAGYYIARFVDSLIYVFIPQICVFILRMLEGRTLLHRMVTRTVIIGDCPWVSQSMEAFVSKLFARSYSIASLNVLSGNPADHLLHRHTHRIVRGSLLVCGRPDGRLSALTNAEIAAVLALSQASSIQSLGSTCESITIGHNASKVALSTRDIYLADHRPKFLCEQILDETLPQGSSYSTDESSSRLSGKSKQANLSSHAIKGRFMTMRKLNRSTSSRRSLHNLFDTSIRSSSSSRSFFKNSHHSSLNSSNHKVLGDEMFSLAQGERAARERADVSSLVADLSQKREELAYLKVLFEEVDSDHDGRISADEFVTLYNGVKKRRKEKEHVLELFNQIDVLEEGTIGFDEFLKVARMAEVEVERKLIRFGRDRRSLLQIPASDEYYFGESLRQMSFTLKDAYALSKSQQFCQTLYESRIASMQRFVAMCVLFHEVGSGVEGFFRRLSFGLLGYQMDQTHSILRVTTTASPVNGSDVRERMEKLRLTSKVRNAVRTITTAWLRYDERRTSEIKRSYHDNLRAHPLPPMPTSRGSDSSMSNEVSKGQFLHSRYEDNEEIQRPRAELPAKTRQRPAPSKSVSEGSMGFNPSVEFES